MDLKADYELKWRRLQSILCEMDADACILANDMNMYYLTGYVFNGYVYIAREGDPVLFVKRSGELSGYRTVGLRKPEQMHDALQSLGLPIPRKLLLEAEEMSYSDYTRLVSALHPQETADATAVMRKMRMIKTPYEIEQTRRCAKTHEAVYREIPQLYHSGMTDLDLQIEIEHSMRRHGSIGFFRAFGANMNIFMGSLLAGENAETPSPFDFALGGAGMDSSCPLGANGVLLKEGMSVMVDMAGNFTPYMTDMTRVFSVGQLTDEAYKAHEVSIRMHREAEKMLRPGASCAELYNMAVRMAEEAGLLANFMGTKYQAKFVGHGLGLQINELPVFTPRSKDLMQEGMVIAFEPKFVIPGTGAVGVENTFLITKDGYERLTNLTEEIVRLC